VLALSWKASRQASADGSCPEPSWDLIWTDASKHTPLVGPSDGMDLH
jgi:hypothetical protein